MNGVMRLLLAIALVSAIGTAWAACTNCTELKDMKSDFVLVTHYTISMKEDLKVAVIYVENTDSAIRQLDCWKAVINGRTHTLFNYTLEPAEKVPIIITLDQTVSEGDTITLTNSNGNVVQAVPLPNIGENDICDAYRGGNGVWTTSFTEWSEKSDSDC